MRYRDMARIDMEDVREKVRQWMLAHPAGTLDEMAAKLQNGYPGHEKAMATVLRGVMARFQDHPQELASPGSGESQPT